MEVFPNHESPVEDWTVTVLETGATTMTGGRVKRAETIVGREPFLLTYGDGLSDVDISKTVFEHQESGRLITMTAVQPEGRFGTLELVDGQVKSFLEKPKGDNNWINGGFFVCQPEVFDAIENTTDAIFERKALEDLAGRGQINCYKHRGFWKCMDTLADKNNLIKMWESGEAPWKTW